MVIYFASVFLLSYLVGSFNFAYLVARIKNIDIKNEGSGNPGTSNIHRVLGRKMAIFVLFGDILKGISMPYWVLPSAVYYINSLYNFNDYGYMDNLVETWEIGIHIAGFAVVFGHCYPIYYKFRGGKGVASFIGYMLFLFYYYQLSFLWILSLLTLYYAVFKSTKTAALASLSVVFTSIFVLYSSLSSSSDPGLAIFISIVFLIFWRHKENFDRLMRGEENKF
ncbi:MAG: glycerol-3-phosphate acyltransferase [Actinomycetota bacterium]|nr:glycerol-3-phosphate acyltransferase [Actinomycetota bacterium]|tara:strand:- start:901 stop:1569 length:669 start_codon:yes stop_codon:yes gene_type:complete